MRRAPTTPPHTEVPPIAPPRPESLHTGDAQTDAHEPEPTAPSRSADAAGIASASATSASATSASATSASATSAIISTRLKPLITPKSSGVTAPPASGSQRPLEYARPDDPRVVNWLQRFFAGYFLLILKNVIGWLMILLAVPIGVTLPGPGGLPVFLIGFALVTFPGKRKLTSRVMRGRPLRLEAGIFTTLTTVASLIVVAGLLWFVGDRYPALIERFNIDPQQTPGLVAAVAGICVIAAVITWGVMWLLLRFVNVLIGMIPRLRRFVRPIMRRWGITLLPPPRRRVGLGGEATLRANTEIIEFSTRHRERVGTLWRVGKPWLRRMLAVGLTIGIFYFVFRPIVANWRALEPFVDALSPVRFAAAVAMLAGVLVLFRLPTWWVILRALGQTLPPAAALRIWMTSELARYLPGGVWQLVGRIWLVRPYQVPAALCSASQLLEIMLFVLANIAVAVVGLAWVGLRHLSGGYRWWTISLALLVPVFVALLHPGVFYAGAARILRWTHRPALQKRVPMPVLLGLFVWNLIGLAGQGFAIAVIVQHPLGLSLDNWWVLTGAYSLAWCAGFAAVWAPGGLGVRELVFMATLVGALPPGVRERFDPRALLSFTAFMAIVLRIWSIAGELAVAAVSYVLDLPGAMNMVRGNRKVSRAARVPS